MKDWQMKDWQINGWNVNEIGVQATRDIVYINDRLNTRDLLEALAEEAAELSQAALKQIRAYKMHGAKNVTPVTPEMARQNVYEELADVSLIAYILGIFTGRNRAKLEEIELTKLRRWVGRLKKAEQQEGEAE
ncbi:hypothetical protein [Acidaminococcus timonensis]|uniref:hypothetical protein n=1 Tax=Acidaminococcus timonensis TaxID=1871002 RepID=UPI00307A6FCC